VGKKKVDENKTWKKLFKKSEKNLKKSEKIGKKLRVPKTASKAKSCSYVALKKTASQSSLKTSKANPAYNHYL
jgi:hypothetical protein